LGPAAQRRAAPERAEIDPAAIRNVLAEYLHVSDPPLRDAAQRALAGRAKRPSFRYRAQPSRPKCNRRSARRSRSARPAARSCDFMGGIAVEFFRPIPVEGFNEDITL
jgi:hypothetical protein